MISQQGTTSINKNCWLQPTSVQTELINLFGGIADEVAIAYEEKTSMREEHLESKLATLIEHRPILQLNERIADERKGKHLRPLKLHLKTELITAQERQHGADIGIVTRVSIPGEMQIDKATLVQGKRLYPNQQGNFDATCLYKEMFSDDRVTKIGAQWDRMLDRTSASVYLLYGPERLRIGRSNKQFGLRVVSAHTVKGLHQSGIAQFSAEMAYNLGKPFGSWLVEEFLCCTVGDTKPNVIQMSLGKSNEFMVRHMFEVDLFVDENFSPQQVSMDYSR